MARPICFRLLVHWARRAASRADCTAGNKQRDQDGDDGDHHQELDQGEGRTMRPRISWEKLLRKVERNREKQTRFGFTCVGRTSLSGQFGWRGHLSCPTRVPMLIGHHVRARNRHSAGSLASSLNSKLFFVSSAVTFAVSLEASSSRYILANGTLPVGLPPTAFSAGLQTDT